MASSISVTIVPPHVSRFGSFVMAKAFVPTREQGLAKIDGTFTSGFMQMEDDVVGFDSAEDAIAWAEAAPRFWTVINKLMFR